MITLLEFRGMKKHQLVIKFRKGIGQNGLVAILAIVCFVSILSLGRINTSTPSTRLFNNVRYVSASSSITDDVLNAKWEIMLIVKNTGSRDYLLEKLNVNEVPVLEYNVASGGEVSSSLLIGTSLPSEGLVIEPGETVNLSIWVGSALFDSGSSVSIKALDTSPSVIPISVDLA